MPLVGTFNDKDRSLTFLLREDDPLYTRDTVVISSGAGVLKAGTVLGKITAGGEYVAYTPGAADGSQNAVAILGYQTDATSADVKAVVIARDAVVNVNDLQWGPAVTTQPHKDTAIAALKALPGPIVAR